MLTHETLKLTRSHWRGQAARRPHRFNGPRRSRSSAANRRGTGHETGCEDDASSLPQHTRVTTLLPLLPPLADGFYFSSYITRARSKHFSSFFPLLLRAPITGGVATSSLNGYGISLDETTTTTQRFRSKRKCCLGRQAAGCALNFNRYFYFSFNTFLILFSSVVLPT